MKPNSVSVSSEGAATLTRQDFLNVFKELGGQFTQNQQHASAAESRFFSELRKCRRVAERDPLAQSPLEPEHPLRQLLEETVQKIKDVFSQWDAELANRETHAKFKERTADSLLVFVYGKVKAGKSSLGNYIAWGAPEPTQQVLEAGEFDPEYFVETSSGLTEKISDESIRVARKFKVGEGETTSAIQGFKLPGLTWVDSPGLHSKNAENGDLALRYVDAADMILYLTNSVAPCKRSDMKELQALGRKEHNLAVLITGSDMVEEDEDDQGQLVKVRVMKTDDARAEQLNYVQSSLSQSAESGTSQSDQIMDKTLRRARVHSISVEYAAKHPDAVGMQHSGVGQMLHDVALLARGAGVRAKLVQPMRNLRSFLTEVRDEDLMKLQQCLKGVADGIAEARAKADSESRKKILAITLEMGPHIDSLLEKHRKDSGGFKRAVDAAYKEWLGQGREAIGEAYAASLGVGLTNAVDDAIGAIPDFEPIKKTFQRKSDVNAKRGAALGSAAGLLALLGPAGWAAGLAIGVTAALVGSTAGSKLGGMLDDNESAEIEIGDNAHLVGAKTRQMIREKYLKSADKTLSDMTLVCYSGLEEWIADLQAQASSVGAHTSNLMTELDERISA